MENKDLSDPIPKVDVVAVLLSAGLAGLSLLKPKASFRYNCLFTRVWLIDSITVEEIVLVHVFASVTVTV